MKTSITKPLQKTNEKNNAGIDDKENDSIKKSHAIKMVTSRTS